MLVHKAARIRQLSGSLRVEEPLPPRIPLQSCFRVENISQDDKALAESSLKKEASAARGSQHVLRRVKSKLTGPDKAVTFTTLCNHVQANGSAEVAQIYINILSPGTAQPTPQFKTPNNLLVTAVRNGNIDLVRLLAPYTGGEAVDAALEAAVLNRDRNIVTALLAYGADPNGISHECVFRVAETDLQLLQLILRAPKQLRYETFGNLCTAAIRNGRSDVLSALLRDIADYQLFSDSAPPWNRDSLLEATIHCPDKALFFSIADSTSNWPLTDNRLFLQVLDTTRIDRCLAKDMLEVLLCLSDMSSAFHASPEIESTLCRCVQEQQEDILRLVVSYGLRISAEPLMLACRNHDMRILDLLLAGHLQGEEEVVARISHLQGPIQAEMRQRILKRLLAVGASGAWKHDELITAVSMGNVQLVEALINADASVDCHNGAALAKAVSLGHVPIVQKLLSRPLSLESLQAAFPSIAQLETLPRRLLTKLFINQGLSGQCLDETLNRELCNYSYHRDTELIDILITAGGHCNDLSLAVAFEHRDAVIFEKIRLSKTVLHESASEWFKSWHQVLFSHVQRQNEHAIVASACLKMLLHKLEPIEELCDAHDGHRRYECFHQFLEHGAEDIELLSACLKWAQQRDSSIFTELLLTAACFCDLNTVHLIARSQPVVSPHLSPSSTFARSGTLNPRPSKSNISTSVQIPPLLHKPWDFSDARTVEGLKIVFRQYLYDASKSHLATKLLKRHLEQCTQATPQGEAWPLLTIQFLLSQPIEVTLSEYVSCLYMAIASQQWLVLGLLLDRQLPRDLVACFFLVDTSSLTPPAIHVLLESQAMACMDDDFFYNVVQRCFDHACLAQNQEISILLCTKSRCKLRITDVLVSLQQAIDAVNLEYVSTLLGATSSSKDELETLWKHLNRQYLSSHFLTIAEILLKAGADGLSITATFIDAIERNDESLVALILAQWQAPRSLQQREEFDYRERQPIARVTENVPDPDYFSVLSRALSVAVRLDRANLCWRLCTSGAPLVYQRQSLIELAVVLGSHSALVELLRYSKTCPEMREAVDFALLQAVVHNRPTWVHNLIDLGGTIEAYDFEPLKIAAGLNHADMLTVLLPYNQTVPGLYAIFRTLQERFAESEADLENLCTMLRHLHKAGFQDQESFSEVLLALSSFKSATLHHASVLLSSGASVEYRDGECMVRLWRQGNVLLFPRMLHHCGQQPIATKLLKEACNDYLQQEPDHFTLPIDEAFLVLGALLKTDIPQDSRDVALDDLARACHRRPDSVAIIRLLLENGARFIDGAGVSLYQVCRLEDPKIKSLVINSRPHARTRLLALYLLFRSQGTTSADGPSSEDAAKCDPSDHACLYNINLPESAAENLELEASDLINLIGAMLNPRGQSVGTSLMFSFFFMLGGLRVLSSQFCTDDDLNEMEQIFGAAITNSISKELDDRVEFLLRVMQIDSPISAGLASDYAGFTLKKGALNRLLLLSLQHKKFCLVSTLLEAGADPNTSGEDGRSALYLATLENSLDTMEALIDNGAKGDDGSLHIATCWQHNEAMQLLLEAGHDRGHYSELFFDATPLEAFLQFGHSEEAKDLFEMTLAMLLCDAEIPTHFWTSEPSPLFLALMGPSPFEMFSALLCYLPAEVVELPLIRRDRFVFSLLSLIERADDIRLSGVERVEMSSRLEGLEFTRTYYAVEGDQPEDAINVPEHLEAPEIRVRRRAYREKDCAVCCDKPPDRKDIHAALSPLCEDNHGWDDDIICTDCLRRHLESQMFPQGNDRFPSAKVKCWAANCPEVLSHAVLREYSDPERFAIYDTALAQLCLNDGENTAKCAREGCFGATWLDEEEDKDVTIITCPVCGADTCIQCNQLYDKHRDEPCPQGGEARGIERRREEEAATAALMAKGKKCPKCELPYERIEGCDHIVCGKDADSRAASRKPSSLIPLCISISELLLT